MTWTATLVTRLPIFNRLESDLFLKQQYCRCAIEMRWSGDVPQTTARSHTSPSTCGSTVHISCWFCSFTTVSIYTLDDLNSFVVVFGYRASIIPQCTNIFLRV